MERASDRRSIRIRKLQGEQRLVGQRQNLDGIDLGALHQLVQLDCHCSVGHDGVKAFDHRGLCAHRGVDVEILQDGQAVQLDIEHPSPDLLLRSGVFRKQKIYAITSVGHGE